jgi:hypothetical protein
VDSPLCEIYGNVEETPEHIIQGCEIAVSFWTALGIDLPIDRRTTRPVICRKSSLEYQ